MVTSAPWPERVDLLQGGMRTGGCESCWRLAQTEEVPPRVWVMQGYEDFVPKAAADE